jgi:hypothetical protein
VMDAWGRDEKQQSIHAESLRESAAYVQQRIATALERIADALEKNKPPSTDDGLRIRDALDELLSDG